LIDVKKAHDMWNRTGVKLLGAVENMKAEPSETARKIDIAQIQGQVHAQSVQKVGELADKNPSEAVSIIRQWMSEPNPV